MPNFAINGNANELTANAAYLATPGKGIFANVGLTFGRTVRITTVDALKIAASCGVLQNFNGVSLHEEALYQTTSEGRPCVDICKEHGVLPGISFDFEMGRTELGGTLAVGRFLLQRGQMYYEAGARFTVHLVVLKIDSEAPSQSAINELAKFAAISQENGLVPIVYPKILNEGSHDIEKCAVMTEHVLVACCQALSDHHVLFEGTMFMTNMVTPGSDAPKVAPEVVAMYTVKTLQRTVPAAVPGMFFSSNYENMLNLNAINQVQGKKPWTLSFFPEEGALEAWVENEENVLEAFMTMAKANSEAALGTYKVDVGEGASNCSYIMLGAVYALGIVLVCILMPL